MDGRLLGVRIAVRRTVAFLRKEQSRRLVTLAGLGVSSMLVWQSSSAAFSATTTNPTNSMTAGTVAISDNDAGVALFNNITGIVPGGTGNNCITVTYSGTATSTVKLYTSGYVATDGAADGATLPTWLKMYIQVATGTCAAPGAYSDVSAASPGDTFTTVSGKTTFANGYGTGWTAAASGNTRAFKFTYTLDSSAPSTAQGDNISTSFVWEAQNN